MHIVIIFFKFAVGCNKQWLCKDCVAKGVLNWLYFNIQRILHIIIKKEQFSRNTTLVCIWHRLTMSTLQHTSAGKCDDIGRWCESCNKIKYIYKCQFSAKNLIENINPGNFSLILNPLGLR